jgi:hypothetical protein
MNEEILLQKLESLIQNQGIELRYEKGRFAGGYYRYRDKKEIIINKELSDQRKIVILANELKDKIDLDNKYITPAVREIIENAGGMGK